MKKSFFDIKNIIFLEKYNKIFISLLKIYSYFNQQGDGFFKEIYDLNYIRKQFKEEFKNVFNDHNFNIMIYGITKSGKSTLINTILDEKRAFSANCESKVTIKSNYYIHNEYPIKFIDNIGYADSTETETNLGNLNSIYNKNNKNIIIDEYMNDTFSYYGDQRNKIHLLLYLTLYNGNNDVFPAENEIIKYAIENNINIIFIINKCEDKLFENEKGVFDDYKEMIESWKTKKGYKKYKTVFTNLIAKRGLDELFSIIYEGYKKFIISEQNLICLKNPNQDEEIDINSIISTSLLKGLNPEDIILNNSLLNSVLDIKTLLARYIGYYENNLYFFKNFGFWFMIKIKNIFIVEVEME